MRSIIFGLLYSLSVVLGFILVIVVWFLFFGPEQYAYFDPYCDTTFSTDFNWKNFHQLSIGSDTTRIKQYIGKPIYIDTFEVSGKTTYKWQYSQDGKLYFQDVPFYMSNDYAWCSVELIIDSTGRLQAKNKCFYYD